MRRHVIHLLPLTEARVLPARSIKYLDSEEFQRIYFDTSGHYDVWNQARGL